MLSECSAVYLPYVNVAKHGHLPLTPSLSLLLSVYRWLQVNGSRGYRCVCGRVAGAVGGGRRGRLQWKQTIKWTRVRIHLTCLNNSFSQTRSIFFCSPESRGYFLIFIFFGTRQERSWDFKTTATTNRD